MVKALKNMTAAILLPSVLLGMTACTAITGHNNIDNEGDSRRVGNVLWNNQTDPDLNSLLDTEVNSDEARLVFIRKNDSDPEQTSANISINDRYQVSLHPGSYTIVNSCVGTNQLSAHATGLFPRKN